MNRMKKLVVLGASGFVGTTLTERMINREDWNVVPVIHSAGNAWRLGRYGRPLTQIDIQDRTALNSVLRDATHVVNCTRGGQEVMLDGLHNVLEECMRSGVHRFVHLSSVLVFGDPPPSSAQSEEGSVDHNQPAGSYGALKLKQDEMVEKAVRRGLPSIVLCPPNIGGPFSLYLCGLVDAIRKESLALVGDGEGPCNLVDVRSLCHAIELALDVEAKYADGKRMFITDGGDATWKDVLAELAELTGIGAMPRSVDRELFSAHVQRVGLTPKPTLRAALTHLFSSDVRAALRKDPLLAKIDKFARKTVSRMGSGFEGRLQRRIEGIPQVARFNPLSELNVGLSAQQLRGVRHSCSRARQVLGYEPLLDWRTSMSDFQHWYRVSFGMTGGAWDLALRLHA